MSNYNVGKMIKLSRQALGISQEELCIDICSVETLSRIENGKHKVKRDTYQKLMERMGRDSEKSYAALSFRDMNKYELEKKIRNEISRDNYKLADKYFSQLKEYLYDTILNQQYIIRTQAVIDYYMDKISADKFVEDLEKSIRVTIPNYEIFLEKVYPFTQQEITVLMNLSTAYSLIEETEKGIKILEMLLRCLEVGYMSEKDVSLNKTVILSNLSKKYGSIEEHEKAIELCNRGIEICKKYRIINELPNLLIEKSWNMMKQIEKGQRDKKYINSCKKYLYQAYYCAEARKEKVTMNVIKNYYESYFNENF